MLAVLATEGAHLNAGSVGLSLARRWSESGERALFVDADASGSRLAERFGAAVRADFSPAARGLPSLIVAREPLTLKSLAAHCYSLDEGSLWALFAPFHPAGAAYAAGWLGERAGDLMTLDRERSVVLASSVGVGATGLAPLLQVAPVLVVLAPVKNGEQAAALWTLCHDLALMGFDRGQRVLIVEGSSSLDDDEIRSESGLNVAGRLPVIDDERVLRQQIGRKDRAFGRELDKIAARLLSLLRLHAEAEARAGAQAGARVRDGAEAQVAQAHAGTHAAARGSDPVLAESPLPGLSVASGEEFAVNGDGSSVDGVSSRDPQPVNGDDSALPPPRPAAAGDVRVTGELGV